MDDFSCVQQKKLRLLILGASGKVGSQVVRQSIAHGHSVTAQTRDPAKIAPMPGVRVITGSPMDEVFLEQNIVGHDAVVLCLGLNQIGQTTFFSDVTKVLLGVMQASAMYRLVVITGVGAGNTKNHGGWFYNNIIYRFITRWQYADKNVQEALIEQCQLDWTIIRPAPFCSRASQKPLCVYTEIPRKLQLCSIAPVEVADFILDSIENERFIHQKPFIGHI